MQEISNIFAEKICINIQCLKIKNKRIYLEIFVNIKNIQYLEISKNMQKICKKYAKSFKICKMGKKDKNDAFFFYFGKISKKIHDMQKYGKICKI